MDIKGSHGELCVTTRIGKVIARDMRNEAFLLRRRLKSMRESFSPVELRI